MRAAALALSLALVPATTRADPPPSVMLWAWERPEDLRFLPANVGVAYLAATVDLTPSGARVSRRHQPLRTRDDAWRVAVVHVQAFPRTAPMTDAARAVLRDAVVRASHEAGVRGVQIDWDAPVSQREAYRTLWREVNTELAPGTWRSMTALASWCVGDRWLDDGAPAVDEVVPMVFTMGRDGSEILRRLRALGAMPSARCRTSVGWAQGEPTVHLRGVERVWVYNPRRWEESAARAWYTSR